MMVKPRKNSSSYFKKDFDPRRSLGSPVTLSKPPTKFKRYNETLVNEVSNSFFEGESPPGSRLRPYRTSDTLIDEDSDSQNWIVDEAKLFECINLAIHMILIKKGTIIHHNLQNHISNQLVLEYKCH